MKPARRHVLAQALAWGAGSALPGWLVGCGGGGGGDPVDGGAPPPPPDPSLPTASASVSLNRQSTGSVLSSRFAGLSYEKNKLTQPLFTATNAALIALYGLLGPGVLRIGANAVDTTSWNGAVASLTPVLPAQVDAFADFVHATGWQVLYGINLANNTLANAQAEARYVADRLGTALLAFEIGNEPDVYHSNGDRPATYAFADFLAEWKAMAAAIAQAVPGAVFSGPAAAYNVKGYTVPFAQSASTQASMLTQHYYRANGKLATSTLALLLQPDPALPATLATLTAATSANALPLGWRMAECNSFYNGGAPDISDACGTALWALDFLFTCALAGCGGTNFHGGGSGTGYTPIADSSGTIVEARPEFFGMLLFALGAQGTSVASTLQAPAALALSAYGVLRTADGGVNVVLVNKSADSNAAVALSLGQSAQALEPVWLTCPGGLSAASGQLLNGAGVGADGRWQPVRQKAIAVDATGHASLTLPPASAVLLRSR